MARPAGFWKTLLIIRDAGYQTPCYEWRSRSTTANYGRVRYAGREWLVHRLAWTEANGDPGELDICHHCDNPPCARLDHLFTGTATDNLGDASAKGRLGLAKGEANGQARLTEQDVRAIRRLAGMVSQRKLADRFDIHESQVSRIITRKEWRHV